MHGLLLGSDLRSSAALEKATRVFLPSCPRLLLHLKEVITWPCLPGTELRPKLRSSAKHKADLFRSMNLYVLGGCSMWEASDSEVV